MIQHPVYLSLFLMAVETVILCLSSHPRSQKYFYFLPAIFWIYFTPMIFSTTGIIAAQSPVYAWAVNDLLPASLLLLLISVDLKAIVTLGRQALIMFFIGSLGVVVGMVLIFFLFKRWVGSEFWSGFGALSASWTGGSSNMIAVKEALGAPDSVYLPMVIVDTIVPYVWMGILVALAGFQKMFDRWNRSDVILLEKLKCRTKTVLKSEHERPLNLISVVGIVVFAFVGGFFCRKMAVFFPVIKDVISPFAWTIILVSSLGILLSLTPVRRLEKFGSNKIGYFILYFVLTAIGAKANLSHTRTALFLIGAGFGVMSIHAIFLFLASRWMRTPLFLAAVASQANVGGVASAPIVAEIYQPGLASVGLLLAILGNVLGTYLGILTAHLCYWVTSL